MSNLKNLNPDLNGPDDIERKKWEVYCVQEHKLLGDANNEEEINDIKRAHLAVHPRHTFEIVGIETNGDDSFV